MKARGHEADFDGGVGGSQPEIPAPKFRHFARLSQTCTFLKKRLSEKYKSSVREIPDLGYADFQRARATTPPARNRLGIPAARHNRERALLRDELVSLRRWRNLRRRCTETSSSRRSARSRLWRAAGILRRFLTGGVVARALWKSAHPRSGISCTEKENASETQFFTIQQFFKKSPTDDLVYSCHTPTKKKRRRVWVELRVPI